MSLLPLHILAGALAIVMGFVALYAAKGETLHRKAGMVFVYTMLVMAGSGALVAILRSNRPTAAMGILTCYLVISALLTVRRNTQGFQWPEVTGMGVALGVGIFMLWLGLVAVQSGSKRIDSLPVAPAFVFGAIALLAAAGDFRMMRSAVALRGAARIARHLWRMCFAMFIATASFFLGQAKVLPEELRHIGLLAAPVLVVLGVMLFWWVKVSFGRGLRRAEA